jgi:Neuraminidase (sialidase)
VDGSNIYVVWADDTPGNGEIYLKKSDDEGATWAKKRRLTNTVGDSLYPAIAVDGSNIYVVWCDSTPGNGEIYFRKGVLF